MTMRHGVARCGGFRLGFARRGTAGKQMMALGFWLSILVSYWFNASFATAIIVGAAIVSHPKELWTAVKDMRELF